MTYGRDARLEAISIVIHVLLATPALRHIGLDGRSDWHHCPPRALGADGVPVTKHRPNTAGVRG